MSPLPMPLKSKLRVEAGMASAAGPNERNDDCLGVRSPEEPELSTKGVAAVIADGVSAAEAGKQAAEICVQGFLNDYYDAPEAWTTQTCGSRVAISLNRWLFGLGQSRTSDGRGYVTTFTAVVLKGETAHVFHVGDTRAYRLRRGELEPMTRDHSFSYGKKGSGLARAMGMDTRVEVDTSEFPLEAGDLYLLTSDGVHGYLSDRELLETLSQRQNAGASSLDGTCQALVDRALASGSNDNCSAILLEVVATGASSSQEHYRHSRRLPFPPDLAPGMIMDGYEIERELQATSRSQTYVATEKDSGRRVVVKTPSVNFEDDAAYIERFAMEGWIGKKLKNDRLASACSPIRGQSFLYNIFEYIEGPDLAQWMKANPRPDVRVATGLAKQILHGLRAMHRQEMLHQDLKPSNVIVHPERGAVLIDYGSTSVAGIQEIVTPVERERALGTLGYSAPEYFLGRTPTRKSDLFSLGVVLYESLTGQLPYGSAYERCQTVRDFSVLQYVPATRFNSHVPVWLDGAIRKAVAINPQSRYDSYSEFEYDLDHPNQKFLPDNRAPFIERNPVRFWKLTALALAVALGASWCWFSIR